MLAFNPRCPIGRPTGKTAEVAADPRRPSSRRRRSCSPTQGYERTTVRDVAARAAIDPAMVMRYFGSKEGLFARATAFDLQLPDLTQVARAGIGTTLVAHFLEIWEGARSNGSLISLLRAAASSDDAANAIRTIFGGQVVPMLARVVPPAELFAARRPGGDADHGAGGHPLYPEGAAGGRHGPGAAREAARPDDAALRRRQALIGSAPSVALIGARASGAHDDDAGQRPALRTNHCP